MLSGVSIDLNVQYFHPVKMYVGVNIHFFHFVEGMSESTQPCVTVTIHLSGTLSISPSSPQRWPTHSQILPRETQAPRPGVLHSRR